jgi:hypothetical protein
VEDYVYLGTTFNYNGQFTKATKRCCDSPTRAMFSLLQKGKQLHLNIETMLHLFNTIVVPIVLYGCEAWGHTDLKVLERVQLRFCKLLLHVKSSTPNNMIYGELGILPLAVKVKVKMVGFWLKLVQDSSSAKISVLMYKLMLKRFTLGCANDWISQVKGILDEAGYSNIWIEQGENTNHLWLKQSLNLRLKDQFIQSWSASIFDSSKCLN